MRTTRKLLALLLAVAMVFTMTAMTALATGGDDGTTAPGGPATPGGGTPTTPDADPTAPGGAPSTPDTPTPPEVSEQAKAVIALIEALPTSDTILADMEAGTFDVEAFKAQVSEAWADYDALSDADKVSVGDISRLAEAEETLALLESISLLGTETVCKIEGGDRYETLQDAVEAVQDGQTATITMLEDVTLTKSVTLPDGVTLDLNGKTISGTANMSSTITIDENATVTITDNLTGGGGKISNSKNTGSSSGAVIVENGAALTLDGGVTLETTGGVPSSLYIIIKQTPPRWK